MLQNVAGCLRAFLVLPLGSGDIELIRPFAGQRDDSFLFSDTRCSYCMRRCQGCEDVNKRVSHCIYTFERSHVLCGIYSDFQATRAGWSAGEFTRDKLDNSTFCHNRTFDTRSRSSTMLLFRGHPATFRPIIC